MHSLFSGIKKAFCLGIIALLFAGCGGGGSGGSSTGGFTAEGDSIRFGGVRVEKSLVPANLNLEQPSLLLPYTTAVIFKIERRNDGSEVPDGTPVQVTVEGVKHGGISVLDDPATDENEFSNLMGSLSTETSGGLVRVFFTSFSEAGEATIIASVQDPVSGNNKIAKATVRVTSDQRPVAALTFTGPFVNAVLTGATRFGDGNVQNGAYSRVLSVIASDADGNPVNPGTQINFFLIDGPLTGYPESSPGAFFVAGNNGDPLEGKDRFDALNGDFVSKGVLPFDRLVLDGGQRDDNPVPDNRFHTGIRTVENVASQTTLFIQAPPFNMGPDNGPTVPYLIGRSQSGTILSPSFTDVNGVADTLLTYPVSRLGQTAILVACTSDFTVCTVLNTCDATGANCGSVYLGASDGTNVSLTTSVPQGQQLKANGSTDVILCLKDPNFAPLPATTIDYAIGNTGAATVTVNGNSATEGTLSTGGDGCVTAPVASNGQVPGSQPVPINFDAGGVATPVTLEIAAPGDGNLTGITNCSINQENLTGQCTVNLLLTDDNSVPIPGILISLQNAPSDPFTINFSPASGGFGITNDQGRLTATINLQGPGSYQFTFTTQGDTATYETEEITIGESDAGGGSGEELSITTSSLPDGTVGVFYSALLAADGGKMPFTWSLENGSLPQGITLDAATGALSGTPSTPGTSNFTIRVTDANKQFNLKPLTITVGQSGGGSDNGGSVAVNNVQLLISSPQIRSAGNDPVTLTAVVRDKNNNVVQDVQVTFNADNDGTVQVVRGITDETGTAEALLLTTGNKDNRTITVTASAGGFSDSNTIEVVGTNIAISGPDSAVLGNQVTLELVLADSEGEGIANRTLSVSTAMGNGISNPAPNTDFNGKASVVISADNAGTDAITVSGAGASTEAGLNISADRFVFTAPEPLPAPVTDIPLNTPFDVTVRWEQSEIPQVGETVNFSATRGTITASAITNGSGEATATITANSAGPSIITATVPGGGPSTQIEVLFIATVADDLILQANPATLGINPPGSGAEQSKITAVVRDPDDNPVKGKTVTFTLTDNTGGNISPPSAVTDAFGEATTTYTAGSISSGQGQVTVNAQVSETTLTDSVTLTVGDKSLFITLGTGNQIEEPDTTRYAKPYSVLVTDAAGGPVSGAEVTFNIVPLSYRKGYYTFVDPVWVVVPTLTVPPSPYDPCRNEDFFFGPGDPRSGNGILDTGEDQNGNDRLDPGNVVTLSNGKVTTDSSGFAFFDVVYAQQFANWVAVELTAQAKVAGSEALEVAEFTLPINAEDVSDEKVSPPGNPSPFGVSNTCSDTN